MADQQPEGIECIRPKQLAQKVIIEGTLMEAAEIKRIRIEAIRKKASRQLAPWLDRMYTFEFEQLESHRRFIEEHLSVAQLRFNEQLQSYCNDLEDGQSAEDYSDFMEADLLLETIPMIQWQAQFLMVYATFEANLNKLCDVVKRRLSSSLSFKDMHGAGFERARTYLSKVGGVEGSFDGDYWETARRLGKLRNTISHSQGRINVKENAHFAKELNLLEGLELKSVVENSPECYILLSSTFVYDAICSLRVLIHKIATFERDWPDSPH